MWMPPGSYRTLEPAVVVPALRGTYGREYYWAAETDDDAAHAASDRRGHGAVALAERQTDGRGRLGRTWVDSALMFSVALYPPPPVARWPELTLVAARAVADGDRARGPIKHPNDVLVDGRKAAGILAEAGDRVVLGIGINVGGAAWPGCGLGRPGPPRAARRRARPARACVRLVAQPVTSALRLPAASCASADICRTVPGEGDREHALRLDAARCASTG